MKIKDLGVVVLGMVLSFFVLGVTVVILQAVGVENPPVLLTFVILFGVPTAFYYLVKRDRRRKRARIALSQGLTLATDTDDDLRRRLAGFPTLEQPSSRMAKDRFRVHLDGVDVLILDYSYVRVSAAAAGLAIFMPQAVVAAARFMTETLVLCNSRELILPQFFLYKRSPSSRQKADTGETFGEEVVIPSEFSAKYGLRGFDSDRIRSLFTPYVTSYFLEHKGLHATGIGSTLITHRPGRLVRDGNLMEAAKEAADLLALLKAASASHTERS